MEKLANLRREDKFKFKDLTYTVYQHDGNMVEVFGNGRFWAWPSQAVVQRLRKV